MNLFAVLVKLWKLTQQVDESALAERMLDGGVKGDGGELGAEQGNPFLGDPRRHKIDLVQHKNLQQKNILHD